MSTSTARQTQAATVCIEMRILNGSSHRQTEDVRISADAASSPIRRASPARWEWTTGRIGKWLVKGASRYPTPKPYYCVAALQGRTRTDQKCCAASDNEKESRSERDN